MNPVNASLLSGALIAAGKWARNQKLSIDNAIGVAGIALGLAIIEQMNEPLAKGFAVLIVVSIAIVHLPTIVKAMGFSK